MNRTLQTTLLGALGGFLGFVLSEMLAPGGSSETLWGTVVHTAWWTALLMLPLTLVLVVAENLLGMKGRWSRGLTSTFLPALLLGAFSGAVAQFFYATGLDAGVPRRIMRSLGWALMGAGVGLILGWNDRSLAKAARGLLGGAVGGFIGGLLFDSFTALRFGEDDTGTVARLVGLTILGAAIGFMLRLSQEFFKDAWLLGTGKGRYEGKQYILAKPVVTLGRSDANDISLYHDDDVPLNAGALKRDGKGWRWEGESIRINGQAQTGAALKPGDRLTLGNTELMFQQKGQVAEANVYTQPLELHGNQQVARFPLAFKHVTIGTQGEVRVQGRDVLPQHAEIRVQNGELKLRALGTVTINDRAVAPGGTASLRTGDLLKIGDAEYALIKAELEAVKR